MGSIRDAAKAYEAPKTLCISELEEVNTELDMHVETFERKDGSGTFDVNVTEIDGKKYRIPTSVLEQLKVQLEERPECLKFRVKKSGSGMQTKYTVIMLD